MSVVVSHPTGNANLRGVLRALEDLGGLDSFWTTLAIPSTWLSIAGLSEKLRRQLGRRAFPEVCWAKTRVSPVRELVRLGSRSLGIRSAVRQNNGWASVDQVYHSLDMKVARYIERPSTVGVAAVFAYEDGALHTFKAARSKGIRCIYDLPTIYWRELRTLLEEEAGLNPQWLPSLSGLADEATKLERKDQEIQLADRIVVASSFTRRSLQQHFGTRVQIDVAPYGAPQPFVRHPSARVPGQPLQLFYAGRLTQPKGIGYLIEALRLLDFPWCLTVAGARPEHIPSELEKMLTDPRCRWLGHVPHQTLLERMAVAHAFVFPSLVEGFGLVLYEAMASGLPVITTPNTAGPDIMTDGGEGFIVPIRDPAAIADRLSLLYHDESRRQEMARAALTAAERSSWQTYQAKIAALIAEVA